jgi:hypothetical protein
VLLAVDGMFFLALLALLCIAQRHTATAAPTPESDAVLGAEPRPAHLSTCGRGPKTGLA